MLWLVVTVYSLLLLKVYLIFMISQFIYQSPVGRYLGCVQYFDGTSPAALKIHARISWSMCAGFQDM